MENKTDFEKQKPNKDGEITRSFLYNSNIRNSEKEG